MLASNIIALIITFAMALAWLRLNDYAAQRGWITSELSRKIIHTGTGVFFVLCWLLFPQSPWGRFLAALVPLAITAQFLLVGLGVIQDEAAVKAMSRSGDRREILRGPLYYGIAIVALTLIYWRESPIGIVAMMLMCGGDGLADILGRRFKPRPLPWNRAKTWAGALGMLAGGWSFAVLVVSAFIAAGVFTLPLTELLGAISLIALAGALVESLPVSDIDNITVTLTAVLLGHLLF